MLFRATSIEPLAEWTSLKSISPRFNGIPDFQRGQISRRKASTSKCHKLPLKTLFSTCFCHLVLSDSLVCTTESTVSPCTSKRKQLLNHTSSLALVRRMKSKMTKTYNSGYSLVVTHLTTNPPVRCLNRAERTGSLVFNVLWSYVLFALASLDYITHLKVASWSIP